MLKSSMTKVKIYRNKTKILAWVLGLICILIPLILLAFSGMSGSTNIGRYDGLFNQIGFAAISILILCLLPILFVLVEELFSKTPALIIGSQGLHIADQPKQSRFLLWQQIQSIDGFDQTGDKIIAIYLNNPDPHLTYGNFWQRYKRNKSYKIHNTPIVIGSQILQVNHHKLVGILKNHLDRQ